MSAKKTFQTLLLITLLTSPAACALTWDPDADADLKFNMNFEDGANYTTTDTVAGVVGVLTDYNPNPLWNPNISFWVAVNAIRGTTSADFCQANDSGNGASNDVNLIMGESGVTHLELALFEIGISSTDKRTFAFWFNAPNLIEGTLIRYAHRMQQRLEADRDKWWEIRINNGRLEFREGRGHIFITTESLLTELGAVGVPNNNGWINPDSKGCDPDTWHHAVIALNRATKFGSKMYIDGVEVPVSIISYMHPVNSNIDTTFKSCVQIGAGKDSGPLDGYEFDGMLDEVRVYHKALDPNQANILYQWDSDDPNAAIAILPKANEQNAAMNTGLQWDIYAGGTGVTKQEIYFGTDPDNFGSAKATFNNGTSCIVANCVLNGCNLLSPNTRYYWRVDSTIDGNVVEGTVWSFTTESGKAFNPTPYDSQTDLDNSGTTDLYWDIAIPTLRTFDVYFSTDRTLVEANDPSVRIEDDITPTQVLGVPTPIPGKVYYWRVNTYYLITNPPVEVPGDIWQFRTEPYKLIFNTGSGNENYLGQGHIIPSLECHLKQENTWYAGNPIATGSLASDGVAIFDFADFNYTSQYDIVVVPDYTPNNDNTETPTPLGIHVTSNFYFDGLLDISGENCNDWDASPKARCGGHRGPRKEGTPGSYGPEYAMGYYHKKLEFESRFGDERMHWYFPPTTVNRIDADKPGGYDVFGLGSPLSPPYKVGGGGGYGGTGGDSGRGYCHGIFAGGASYGDKEVPVPFGGSAGSWGMWAAGSAGGGGIEIIAAGNVTLGNNAQILSNGGTNSWRAPSYPGGGGSGGSVKIIAAGSFTNAGIIEVNGGKGQDAGEKASNTAGGGAGGRVAVFYGSTCTQGTIKADGGEKGVVVDSGAYPSHNGLGLSEPSQDGTIYVVDSDEVSPKKASAPTPKDGDRMVYDDGSHQVTLKWYSGFGATTHDQVYFGEVGGPNTMLGNPITPARGQHTCSSTASVEPDHSYYWYVLTDGTVKSDVWEFTVVNWECLAPDWETYAGMPWDPEDPDMMAKAGRPAWDYNHDCVVNYLDLWYFAQYWQENRGGEEFIIDTKQLASVFLIEWMTCRARTNNGCDDWPLTPSWTGQTGGVP